MIDHETARRSFATSLDFTLEPAEDEALDAHLAGCPSCRAFSTSLRSDAAIIRDLETGPVPVAIRANVAIAAEHGRRSNPVGRWIGIAVFAALLLGALGAGALGVGGRGGSGVPGPSSPGDASGPAQIAWDTKVVALSARAFEIDVRGKTFRAATPTVDVTSDPGTLTYRTLEATWKENGVEMRLNIYFTGDSGATWAEEIRIYDGEANGDWLTARGIFFKTPLGAAWTGDEDITVADPTGQPAHIRFAGLTLVNRPVDGVKPGTGIGGPKPVGPITAEVGSGPFDTGGQLHCSGILQMSPREAQMTLKKMGLAVTWRYYTQNDTYIEARDEPPTGTVIIDDGTNVVGSAGQILIAIVDPTSPLAKAVPFPADCPQADPNMTPPPPKR